MSMRLFKVSKSDSLRIQPAGMIADKEHVRGFTITMVILVVLLAFLLLFAWFAWSPLHAEEMTFASWPN